jgi:DNA repair protein RecO (recombination protein O)
MTADAVYGQPAYILRRKPYRETSAIVDVLTRDFGRFSVLAKGITKAKTQTAALLQPFIPVLLSYTGAGELKTLIAVEESTGKVAELQGLALYCGFYTSELVYCLLQTHDPHPGVFDAYHYCLQQLAINLNVDRVLRVFEMELVEQIGYSLQLTYDYKTGLPVTMDKQYTFDIEHGPYENSQGNLSGSTLIALQAKTLTQPQALAEAKALMRMVVDFYVQGRPLKSRQVMNQIMQRTRA